MPSSVNPSPASPWTPSQAPGGSVPSTNMPSPIPGPGAGLGSLTGAPPSALLDQLVQRYAELARRQDETIAQYQARVGPIFDAIFARANTAEGFSPAALSALRSQSTSTIPKQYEAAAQQARVSLLRQGAIGAGELPGSPGDILRQFAPLDQARADAVAGANRSTILANETEQKRTLDLNRTRAQEALNQLTGATGMIADLQNPLGYAAAAQGQQGVNNQLGIAQLQAETQRMIANLDADTQRWMGTLSANTQTTLANLSATTQTNLANLDAATRLKIADIDNASGIYKPILLSSLLSGIMAPGGAGTKSILSEGIGGLIKILKGGQPDPADADKVETSIDGNLGTKIKDFLKNPYTIGVGAALAAGAIWLKTQAHWEANTMVQQFENPFNQNYLAPFVQEFTKAYQSGQLSKAQAEQMRVAFVQNWDEYVRKAREFGQKGSDEKTVSDQSILHLWAVTIQPILSTIDSTIGQLA